MTKPIFLIFLLILMLVPLCCSSLFLASQEAKDVGRISGLKGDVVLARKEKNKMVESTPRLFQHVNISDRFRIPMSGSLKIIFYHDNHEVEIKGKSAIVIVENNEDNKKEINIEIVSGSKNNINETRPAPRLDLPVNLSQSGRSIAAGVLRDKKSGVRANFGDMTGRPAFTWKPWTDENFYEVTLSEKNGADYQELMSTVVTTNSFTIPEDKPALDFGKEYRFVVTAYKNDPRDPKYEDSDINKTGSNESSPFKFILPSEKTIDFINGEEKKLKHLAKGSEEWKSSALYFVVLSVEYGLTEKAGAIARELYHYEEDNRFIKDVRDSY